LPDASIDSPVRGRDLGLDRRDQPAADADVAPPAQVLRRVQHLPALDDEIEFFRLPRARPAGRPLREGLGEPACGERGNAARQNLPAIRSRHAPLLKLGFCRMLR
jgi:hypothetical protein